MKELTCQMRSPAPGLPCKHNLKPDDKTQPGFCASPGTTFLFCTEAMKHKWPSISYSSLTDFIHCKIRYYHRTVEGLYLKPEQLPEPIKLGRAWDAITRSRYDLAFDPIREIEPLKLSPVQAAKINGLNRAFTDLEVQINRDVRFQKVLDRSGMKLRDGFVLLIH